MLELRSPGDQKLVKQNHGSHLENSLDLGGFVNINCFFSISGHAT